MGQDRHQPPVSFYQAFFPVGALATLIVYGLIVRVLLLKQVALPLEIIFILAAAIAVAQQLLMGCRWLEIQSSIVNKLSMAMPAFLILFSIGLVIGSWMICGTIPMLVDWGLRLIHPDYLYFVAFLGPVIFSTLTGTSWGSVGTIGVVLMGISNALGANPGITAGAIIGGAYFGDKMSPLSDTTNLAALAAEVTLQDHIGSMTWTTVPAAIIAAALYLMFGLIWPVTIEAAGTDGLQSFLDSLRQIFNYNILLLSPPAIVLFGSLKRWPTVPVLLLSILTACGLTLVFQRFDLTDVFLTLHKGFQTSMATWVVGDATNGIVPASVVSQGVQDLLNRGGLYALNDAIITAFMVFIFIGAIDNIRAMPIVVNGLLGPARSARATIVSSLIATGLTNAMTSNQYATTFIVGDAFKARFDLLHIPRRVLSRSLEDTGTMIESLIPWTATTVFMVETLGVPWASYWHWQLLSLISITIAFVFAGTGIGCFLKKETVPTNPGN